MRTLYFIIACSFAFFSPAFAQETSGSFGQGSVLIGFDNRTCDGTLEGAVRYNSATACVELCEGSAWACQGGVCGVCVPPSGCPNFGDTCADGSKFAGFGFYSGSCLPFFINDTNQSTGAQWRSSGSGSDSGANSMWDGKANQAWIVANRTITNFPAFNLCETLDRHGHQDWYLPAPNELFLISQSFTPIGGFNDDNYWASAEFDSTRVWATFIAQWDDNGSTTPWHGKSSSYDVRCVRRD